MATVPATELTSNNRFISLVATIKGGVERSCVEEDTTKLIATDVERINGLLVRYKG